MKALLTGVNTWSQFHNILNKTRYELLIALAFGAGLADGFFAWLQPSCNGMEIETEKRKAEIVKLYIDLLLAGVDVTTGFLDPNSCVLPSVTAISLV